jgi:hypothetical protein
MPLGLIAPARACGAHGNTSPGEQPVIWLVRMYKQQKQIGVYSVLSLKHISPCDSRDAPEVFYTYFHKHAHRLRLEKLLYLELPRSPSGFF